MILIGIPDLQERSAHEHGDITAREEDDSDGVDGLVILMVIVRPSLGLILSGIVIMSAIADKKRGAAQRGSETGAQGDRAAADEITSDTVLLLGADDGVEIDIIADQFADLLVRKGHAAVVHEAGTVAMNLGVLGFSALCQAHKNGHEAT
jgi:hypothetical protein